MDNIKPPTKWIEVPEYVRNILSKPFTKKSELEGEPPPEQGQQQTDRYAKWRNADGRIQNGLPGLSHAADILGWRAGDINANWGGPRPVSNLLIGAGLGALGGYGLGALAEELVPDKYINKRGLRNRAALIGGLALSVPPIMQGIDAVNYTGNLSSIFDKWPPPVKESVDLSKYPKITKEAAAGIFDPTIPRNPFVRIILEDPTTPLPLRAASAGLVEAASTVTGSSWVSPFDVAKIAIGAGAGYASGVLAGKALSVLAGLTPEGREAVQRAGMWAGILKATVPQALGLER